MPFAKLVMLVVDEEFAILRVAGQIGEMEAFVFGNSAGKQIHGNIPQDK